MNKNELIVLTLIKTFSGKIVTDYPAKGTRLSDISGGEKPVNPFPIGKLEDKEK